jgi:hexosaminidase
VLKTIVAVSLVSLLVVAGCRVESPRPSGDELAVTWGVITNLQEGSFKSELTLANNGSMPLPPEGWELYFNFARIVIPESVSSAASIEHVNGDLHRLTPRADFGTLGPGERRTISFDANYWVINESEAPAGLYIVFPEEGAAESIGTVTVLPFEREEQTSRGAGDRMPVPTPESRYRENEALRELPIGELDRVIPTPVALRRGSGALMLDRQFEIHHHPDLEFEAAYLADALGTLLGGRMRRVSEANPEAGARRIRLRLGPAGLRSTPAQASEGYRLTIDTSSGIDVVAAEPAGVFYGIQTLRAWVPVSVYRQPSSVINFDEVTIEDFPRFPYRGQHLDSSRNFHRKESVLKLLDLMSFYKLNKFHFHITDDEGWRLEIPGLPELTDLGARRGHTRDESDRLVPSFGSGPYPDTFPGSGYYSRQDFIEILRFATERHIEVIPEIDVPGHARAAIKAMEARHERLAAEGRTEEAGRFLLHDPEDESTYRSVQGWHDNVVSVCQESTYAFFEEVVRQVAEMYQEAGAPLRVIHTGGDEVPSGVWEGSPRCQALAAATEGVTYRAELTSHFLRRLHEILEPRGLVLAGWEEIALVGDTHDPAAAKFPNPEFADKGFRAYVWNSVWGWGGEENAYRLANAGYPVVICNASNFYFDLAYNKDPKEPGYYWAGFVDLREPWEFIPLDLYRGATSDAMGNPIEPDRYGDAVRLTPEGTRNILGIQGQLWSENAKSPEVLEYLVFPKLLGLAERAWAESPAWAEERDTARRNSLRAQAWNRFVNTVGRRELPRLDHMNGGVQYRIPLPGAIIEDGRLHANVGLPGLEIRYTTDGSEPSVESQLYRQPVPVDGTVLLRSFDTRGRGSRVSQVAPTAPSASLR